MKIVSWNCNGAFRKKYEKILELDADIYIIQECEPIVSFKKELNIIISNGIWEKGLNAKGVLVFAKNDVKLEKLEWNSYGMRVFMPIMVNDSFSLVAVWTNKPAYIEEFYIWQLANSKCITDNCIILGDFNSNAVWDKEHNERGHSVVVNMLKEKGLESAYHYVYGEKQGEETKATFYMHKKVEKPFHIDHCFIKPELICSYNVLDKSWLDISDHIPIVLEMNEVDK